MILLNGILCLVVAVILLIQIKKTQEVESNQILTKFVWIYWAILVLIGINHLASGIIVPYLSGFISSLGPVTDALHAIAGIILSLYLSKRRHNQEQRKTRNDKNLEKTV